MLAIALCAIAVSASAADWHLTSVSGERGVRAGAYLVDKSTITCNQDVCQMWDMYITFPLKLTILKLKQYDCKSRTTRVQARYMYMGDNLSPTGGGGATLDPWDYIVPGSEDEKYCDIACGKTEINDFMFKDFNRDNVGEMLLALSNVYAIAPIVPKKNQQK